MTFEQLQYFVAVYQSGSITQAAKQLHIARQSLSESIQQLEQEYSLQLFLRSRNGITPTEAGDILYRSALNILQERASLNHILQQLLQPTGEKQVVTIGLTQLLMVLHGEEISEKLHEVFPNVRFIFTESDVTNLPAVFYQADLSIIVTNEINNFQQMATELDYVFLPLFTTTQYVWISEDSPLAKHSFLTYEQLKDYQHLILKDVFSLHVTNEQIIRGKNAVVKLKSTFVDLLENSNCYAIDLPINHGRLIYDTILQNKKVLLKPLNLSSYCFILYKETSYENFISVITPILYSHFQSNF